MEEKNENLVSIVARHEALNSLHYWLLSFHGAWAVICWFLFVIQWIRLKGTPSHKFIGKFILFAFLVPLELTGLFLCPYLFLNIKRENILLSSGHLVVPSMGFLFVITTYRAFKSLQCRWLNITTKYIEIIIFFFQTVGSFVLSYKLLFSADEGIEHENNLELFLLTTPFTLIELYLLNKTHKFGHVFYIKYLTLQMFPGSMIVLARDNYWLWGKNGVDDVRWRILIENVLMLPLYYLIYYALMNEKSEETFCIMDRNKACGKKFPKHSNVKEFVGLQDYRKHLF